MLKHINTIKDMHELVWQFRSMPELNAVWKTPEPHQCLKFACTECGELMDVGLREEDFARNSEKQGDFLGELADVGIMLCSALPVLPSSIYDVAAPSLRDYAVDGLFFSVGFANHTGSGTSGFVLQALDIVCDLFEQHQGADPIHYVRVKLERTYRKFVRAKDETVNAVVTLEIDAPQLIDWGTLQDEYSGSLIDVLHDVGLWDAIDTSEDAWRIVKASAK
jgi:hypothetical protein